MSNASFVRVLVPLPFHQPFDYTVSSAEPMMIGDYVRVPFGKKEYIGVVWEVVFDQSPHPKTKDILEKIPLKRFPQKSMDFLKWVAAYTLTPLGLLLKMALSVPAAFDLIKKKISEEEEKIPLLTPVSLSYDQTQAVQSISQVIQKRGYKTFLLDGVTGSGKTEVYFQAMSQILEKKDQALVLLPEISLSAQWLERFEKRFGVAPTVWHSSLTPARRRDNWRAISQGKAKVIIGARSALFLPYHKLGLIVVDEEHDSSYKQEEVVIYNARDMAVSRGNIEKIPVILASATPSLESLENASSGKYVHLKLPSRHGNALFPEVILIDMRQKNKKSSLPVKEGIRWISPSLLQALEETLSRKEQALLFLNRRGYAPMTLCGACGERISCPYCTTWLVEHKIKSHMTCHQCGHTVPPITHCSHCGESDTLIPCGPGVERVSEELTRVIPPCRHRIVASDVIHSLKIMEEITNQFQNHEIDVLIGTQMLAKGFHFPNLTLVGVIDADLGLSGSDLRASEKTYQLLHQVGGRAGREDKPGRVFLQTYQPDHPLFAALQSHERDSFLEEEMICRRLSGMPPYGRLAALIVSGANLLQLRESLQTLNSKIPYLKDVEVWGPAPAPLSLLRGKHRWRYLLKTPKEAKIQTIVQEWLKDISLPRAVTLRVDIDPYSFL